LSQKPELLTVAKKQKKIEKDVARALRDTKKNVDHIYVKALLDVLINDSMKHAALLQAIIDIKEGRLERSFLDIQMGPRIEMAQSLKKHIRSEWGMLSTYTELEKQVDEPGIKHMLKQIAEDEKRAREPMTEKE